MEPLGLLAESRRTPIGKLPIEFVAAGIDGKAWMRDEIRLYKMVHEPIPAWRRHDCQRSPPGQSGAKRQQNRNKGYPRLFHLFPSVGCRSLWIGKQNARHTLAGELIKDLFTGLGRVQ